MTTFHPDPRRDAAKIAGSVIVVGSSTVADDVASSLRRLGPRVTLVHPEALADDPGSRDLSHLVVWALGTWPDTQLALDAGLGSFDGARIDPAGRTIDPAILATGGLLGIEDKAAAEAHARSVASALIGVDAIPTIDGWPRDPADATW